MSKKQPQSSRNYSDREQRDGLLVRRYRAFTDRSREPGDAATWAVVLGSFMWTALIICLSVAEQLIFAAVSFVLTFVWVGVMTRFGKVNVPSILWGSSTTDADKPPNEPVVFHSTLLVALISLVAIIQDLIGGWDFGWYGIALSAAVVVYLMIYTRVGLQSSR